MKSKFKEEYICQNHLYIKCSSKKRCCLMPRAQIRNIITVLFLIYYEKFNQIYSKSFIFKKRNICILRHNLNCEMKGIVFNFFWDSGKSKYGSIDGSEGWLIWLWLWWDLVVFPEGKGFGFKGWTWSDW